MANCSECGKKFGFFEAGTNGMCTTCLYLANISDDEQSAVRENIERNNAIEAVILTTEAYPQGLKIVERIEVVTAECAFGMNIFKDLFAGVRDIVGGRSEAVQKTLRDSRRTALYELKKEAYEVGANAVVGVDLDYVELSSAGSMILLVASGTAVKLDNS